MSGQRPGSSDHDAEWWRDDVSYGAPYRDPYQEQQPAQQYQGHEPQPTPRQAAVPGRQGGRAEARRAQQQQQARAEVPPPAGPGGRAAARAAAKGKGRGGPPGPGGKKRNRKKVVAWVATGALALVVLTGGALYLKLNGNITTFDKDGLSTDRPDAAAPDANGNTPINVLLIGSDSRAGGNADLGGGEDGGARSDTTILLHVYADRKHAVGVSFPRDAMTPRPKCKLPNGKWTKEETSIQFNSAFSVGETDVGNPACTQNTVEKITGLRVDHTIVVNFQGFASMTSAIGGVNVCLPNAVYENDLNPKLPRKGKQIFPKGEQTVSGQKALDYVRLRHGVGDGSDIGRMKRQQAFLSALIKDVKGKGMDATTLLPLADAATKSLIVDEDLGSPTKLLSFALSMKNIDLHNIQFITAPWRFEGARVALTPEAAVLWQALKTGKTLDGQDANAAGAAPASQAPAAPAGSAPAAPPAAVKGAGIKVSVYNGTTTAGLTAGAVNALKESSFTVGTVGNASTQTHATTLVQYGPGQKASAQTVAALFPGATLESSTKAGINLVLGKDYAAANGGTTTPATTPTAIPSSIAQAARPADTAACDDVSYGPAGG
ncbi:LCP family protein [Kitasatospora sp. NPDC101801]|uniref:LCP family protein n=1 Tax=Kitasatospora sp. NPDC101801 TaxID=3364103 RepID=UPI00382057B7